MTGPREEVDRARIDITQLTRRPPTTSLMLAHWYSLDIENHAQPVRFVDARQAIPPSHRMNVIRCERARLGLEPTKAGNSVNVRPYLFSISRSPLPRFGS